MPPQGQPIQYILSPSHAIASPLSSPVQINPQTTTIVRGAHQTSVIKQNQAFTPLVVKPHSPSSSQTSVISPTPSRRVSESAKTDDLVKSPTPKLDLSMLAEAADSMGYISTKQETVETPPKSGLTGTTENVIKKELVTEPVTVQTSTPPAPIPNPLPNPSQPAKKPRGRPKGLTKAVLEERKKNEAAKPEKKPRKTKATPKKQRVPKQAPVKEGQKAAEETKRRAEQAMKEMGLLDQSSSSQGFELFLNYSLKLTCHCGFGKKIIKKVPSTNNSLKIEIVSIIEI